MDIAKLGEFGLIDHLTKGYENKNASTVYGVGDDCAVMHYPDKEVLITTDMLMEGVHFDLTYIDMQHLGYKSAMVNISDIFAMNGTPRQMVVSIALSKRFKVEDLDDFYKGLRMACDNGALTSWVEIPPLRLQVLPSALPASVRPTRKTSFTAVVRRRPTSSAFRAT